MIASASSTGGSKTKVVYQHTDEDAGTSHGGASWERQSILVALGGRCDDIWRGRGRDPLSEGSFN